MKVRKMEHTLSQIMHNPLFLILWYSVTLVLVGVLMARFVNLAKRVIIKAFYTKQDVSDSNSDVGRQVTIVHSAVWVVHVLIWLVIASTIASKAGLPQGIITGLGTLIGAGVGFGSQEVFRDVFKGTINLSEKQFSIGNTVKINTASGSYIGVVEKFTLRYVAIRTLENLTCIPQGIITVIENYDEGNGVFVVKLPFSTDADLNTIVDKIKQYMDTDTKETIKWISPEERDAMETIISTELMGVSSVDQGNIVYSISGETLPGNQFVAKRALLKYLSMRLSEDNIYFADNMILGGVK